MTNRFDENASTWDSREYRVRLAESVSAAIRKEVQLSKQMEILDFGCGTGLVSLSLAGEVASLTGVDNSSGMLAVLMEKAASLNLVNVRSLNLNLGEGDILPGSYDLILSSMTFHHVKDVPSLIRTMYQSIRPGGYLCVADLDPDHGLFHSDNTDIHHFGFERETMMSYFLTVGFKEVRTVTAANLPRVGEDGVEREYSVFLVTGVK
ncbi:MAG: class I SAM-dependent methyltransferase [Bacteroidales bacterium]|jgi:2-polyprenyl-3-methyl-5-hydroxy-6-metoxy-1,4-benzoquinol methylase